jgi:peptidyl-prolyl cis-trans isomerase SurA
MAVAVPALAGCRTSPNVAAYVGDEQVTVTELESAVHERLADPQIAAYADGKKDEFTRRVLSLLVQEEVYSAVAQRYDVPVRDEDVRGRIDELLGKDDPEAVYGQLAQQGIGREDVFENVRQQLVRQRIAESEGQIEVPTEPELRARYEQVKESLAQISFGYVTVPDEATAAAVLGQLTATPDAYPAVAAQFPGPYTLPALESRAPDKVPSALAAQIAAAAPGTGFTLAVPETGGVVVGFVAGPVYPPFEEVRPQLEKEAADQADKAGNQLVADVRTDLGVTVNPRFGVLEKGELVPGTGGVVDILEKDGAAATGGAGAGTGTPGN